MSAAELLVALLLLAGAFLMLVASVGLVRFPDLYTRMSAASKTSTLGALLALAAVALALADLGAATRALAAALFLLLTAPVGAHAIGRAARRRPDTLWARTRVEEQAPPRG